MNKWKDQRPLAYRTNGKHHLIHPDSAKASCASNLMSRLMRRTTQRWEIKMAPTIGTTTTYRHMECM